jgi:hypothetical protein
MNGRVCQNENKSAPRDQQRAQALTATEKLFQHVVAPLISRDCVRIAWTRNATMKRGQNRKSPVVKKVVKHITYNINNMHNYFAPQSGPAPAPDAPPEAPPHLFPQGEREIRAPYKDYGTYRRVLSKRDGELIGDCGNCSRKYKDITEFAPDECLNNGRKRPAFFAALEAYRTAHAVRNLEGAREARDQLDALRSILCPSCRKTNNKLTGLEKACRDCWVELRQEACERHGGCMNPDCREKGPSAWQVLEADHLEPEQKIHMLSDYPWWSCNGGPAKMRAEAVKCQWLCRFCHRLEKTGTPANRCGDPDLMSDGKWDGTEEEVRQYHAKRHAKIRYPKQKYVDAEKLRRGGCMPCEREVTPATVVAFDFDHRDPEYKMRGKGTLAGKTGGVGGLVHNCAKAAALDQIRDLLDAEMAKCNLLCANCHKRKTWGYEEEEEGEGEGEAEE